MDWTKTITQVSNLLNQQAGLKTLFVWEGKSYWGVRTALRREIVNTDAGLEGIYAFSLLCPASMFGAKLPIPRQDKITIDGTDYRVLSVDTDAVKSTVRLNLGDILA